jgi:hypothetical protein
VLFHQCPAGLRARLIVDVDFAVGQCYWRRRFLRLWQDQGVDAAYADFLANAPKVTESLTNHVTQRVEEIRQWRSNPSPT